MILDAPYWEGRYASKNTGWDIGDISTPIKEFVDGLSDKSLQVLIPGAGNGHEAIYMREKGFDKVTVLDWSVSALNNIKSASPDFPDDYLIKGDFFEHLGQYDLILEQTFFCVPEIVFKSENYLLSPFPTRKKLDSRLTEWE